MSDQSRTTIDNFAKGAGISTIGRLAGREIGYLGHVVLARMLLPESYGLFALGWTLFRLLTIVSPLGLDNGMIRYGSKYWRKDTAGFRGILIASLLGALVFSVLIGMGITFSNDGVEACMVSGICLKTHMQLGIKETAKDRPVADTAERIGSNHFNKPKNIEICANG